MAGVLLFGGAQIHAQGKSGKTGQQEKQGKAPPSAQSRSAPAAQTRIFSTADQRLIREWFSNKNNQAGLPPGLAKRETLPPGVQRQLQRNGKLPPGLDKQIQPLPPDLESRLPQVPPGVRRIVIGGNVILLEEKTAAILDIIERLW